MIIDPDPFDILRNIELIKKVLSWRIWKRMNNEIGTFSLNHPNLDNTNESVKSKAINLSLNLIKSN